MSSNRIVRRPSSLVTEQPSRMSRHSPVRDALVGTLRCCLEFAREIRLRRQSTHYDGAHRDALDDRTNAGVSLRGATVALLFAAATVMASSPAMADEIRYSVAEGDTLIGLGERLLARPGDWPQLQRLNRIEDPRRIPVGTTVRIPVRLLRPEPLQAEVAAVYGTAVVDGRPAVTGEQLAAGASLRTGEDGRLALRLPDGSVLMLPARSSAKIDDLHGYPHTDAQNVRLKLEQGRVESSVAPQRGPAARYRIDTPTAVIGVRGTDFRVGIDADRQRSRAEVTTGAVEVDGVSASAPRQRAREVVAGFGLLVGDGALGAPVPLPSAPDLSALPTRFERPLIRFALPSSDDAQAHRVQVFAAPAEGAGNTGTAAALVAPALFDDVFRGEARIPGLADGHYEMRVRGITADGLEGLDTTRVFELKARPEPPFPSTPHDGGRVSEGRIGFEWAGVPEAAHYHFQVSDEAGFESLRIDEHTERTRQTATLEPGVYFWRIASIRADGDRGPWSDPVEFDVRPMPAEPEPPEFDEDTMVFHWRGEPGQRFEYEFAADMAFSDVLVSGDGDTPHFSVPRPGLGTYWIRVRSIDPDGYVSPWTTPQQVVVPAPFPWWMLLPLLIL